MPAVSPTTPLAPLFPPQHILDEVRQERRERAELGTRMPYQRTLP